MLNIDTVLVPVDFSRHTPRLVAHARAIAAQYSAAMELVHVIEDSPFPAFYQLGYVTLHGKGPDVEDEARKALARLSKDLQGADLRHGVGYHVRRGHVAQEIVEMARNYDTDLIVIASHGLDGVETLLMGSVAERVVREAPCPVLVVKMFGKSLVPEEADVEAAEA